MSESLDRTNVWCLVPAMNEAAAIAGVVAGATAALDHVLVVDDGSSDATGERAAAAGAVVIRHEVNRGKGYALRTGLGHALAEGAAAVVAMDADGQHDPSEVPRFVDAANAEGADMVIGTRMGDVSTMPRMRFLTNRVTSAVISWRGGQRVTDSQCGFRLVRRALWERLELSTGNFDTESEMIIRASRAGFRITEVPISTIYHETTEGSKIKPLRDTFRFIRLVLRSLRW